MRNYHLLGKQCCKYEPSLSSGFVIKSHSRCRQWFLLASTVPIDSILDIILESPRDHKRECHQFRCMFFLKVLFCWCSKGSGCFLTSFFRTGRNHMWHPPMQRLIKSVSRSLQFLGKLPQRLQCHAQATHFHEKRRRPMIDIEGSTCKQAPPPSSSVPCP